MAAVLRTKCSGLTVLGQIGVHHAGGCKMHMCGNGLQGAANVHSTSWALLCMGYTGMQSCNTHDGEVGWVGGHKLCWQVCMGGIEGRYYLYIITYADCGKWGTVACNAAADLQVKQLLLDPSTSAGAGRCAGKLRLGGNASLVGRSGRVRNRRYHFAHHNVCRLLSIRHSGMLCSC